MMTDPRPSVLCFEPEPVQFAALRDQFREQYRLVWAQTVDGALTNLALWGRRLAGAIVRSPAGPESTTEFLTTTLSALELPTVVLAVRDPEPTSDAEWRIGPMRHAFVHGSFDVASS